MVIAECLKRAAYRAEKTDLYFYRTASQVEVDLIVERAGEINAYEIKFAKTLSQQMAAPMLLFMKDHTA